MKVHPERIERLLADAEQRRKRHQRARGDAFHSFVPADYDAAFETLQALRDRADNFLELGSGSGVITILADWLGFDAYGIEIEPWLVESARELASVHGSRATFATGSFLPRDFDVERRLVDADFHITYDGAEPAYDELGYDLDDFDLVYAFPWPGEEELFHALMREHGREGGLFLTYGASDGFVLHELRG